MLPGDTRAGWFVSVPPSLVQLHRGLGRAGGQIVPSPQPVHAGIWDKSVNGAHSVFRGIASVGDRWSTPPSPRCPLRPRIAWRFQTYRHRSFSRPTSAAQPTCFGSTGLGPFATGHVTLRPLTEVTGIRVEPSGELVVSVREIDRWGPEVARNELGCDLLYLSAGVPTSWS
jgi:hypothetical protein